MALNLGPLNVLLRLQGAEKFKRDTKSSSRSLDLFGKSSIAAGAAVTAVGYQIAKATQVFAEFERGMVRVGAVTNSLGTQAFAGLTERAQDLAKTTEFTARQVSDAMGFMGMAGMKTNQIFEATPAVLQLASAGMVDVASAADTVTNIMAGYGLKTEDLNKANNVLVATFTNSNTSLQQLGQSFKYVGPVAKSAGVQFKEAAAVIGLMGNAGIQADMAGTALRGTIIKLLDPTAEGAKIMRQYGINVQDSNGKLKPMIEIFKQLEPIADDSAKMIELFGLRAGPGMQAALTQGTGALEKLIEKIDGAGNIAERIAKAQMETLDGKIKIMKSNFEGLQIAIGDAFSETVQSAVEDTSGYIADLTKTVKELSRAADGASGSMFELGTESNTAMRNMIRAIGASLGFGMEGVTPSEALPGEFGKGAEIIAERAKTQQEIIRLSEKQNDLLRRGSAGILDYEEQIAKLVAQLNHYDQALKNTGERLRQAVKPAEEAAKATEEIVPKPKRKRAAGLSEEEQKKQFDAARAAYLREIAPTDFDAAAEGITAALAKIGYAPAVSQRIGAAAPLAQVGDVIKPLVKSTDELAKKQAQAAEEAAALSHSVNKASQAFGKVGAAVMGGTLGATFGADIAESAGTAIGSLFGGAEIGGSIGRVAGELFGPTFDVIVSLVGALKPFLDLVNTLVVGLLLPLVVSLTPAIADLSYVLGILIPIANILGGVIGALGYVVSSVTWVIEAMGIAIENFIYDLTGGLFGNAQRRDFQAFEGPAEYMRRLEEERAKVLEELNGETNTTTDKFRELNEELTNVPVGIKKFRAMQFESTRGVVRGTPFGQSAFGV